MTQPVEPFVLELFARNVERQPEAIAVACGDVRLTYAETSRRCNQLATRLAALGVGPELHVALCLERSVDIVIALLGIMRAGGAYVPLDPGHPRALLEFMIADSGAVALLTDDKTEASFSGQVDVPLLRMDQQLFDTSGVLSRAGAEHLAYVIYTSGSTGRPKGVAVTHRNLSHSTLARLEQYSGTIPCCLVLPTVAVDSCSAGIFWALVAGGTVVMPGRDSARDPERLAALIEQYRVSHIMGLWSTYNDVLDSARDQQIESLRVAVVGGEPCPPKLVERHHRQLPHARLFNEYGPTEATIWSTVHECATSNGDLHVPIGKPIAGTRVYLLDENLNLVADGTQGELYVAGAGVAREYWRQPCLTATRFLPDPFSKTEGARMYRTGDLARWRADGTLEFIGRNDYQVKVRGYRVEPGEVEAVLGACPGGAECVVVGDGQASECRLVAYVAAGKNGSPAPDKSALRDHLRAHLPEYMVPAEIVVLDRLPRTLNGKIDRNALSAARSEQPELELQHVGRRTPVEEALAAIWCEVLGAKQVGVQDNFFDVGGHSMRLVRVASLIKQRLGLNVAMVTLLSYPTIESLAAHLAEETETTTSTAAVGQ